MDAWITTESCRNRRASANNDNECFLSGTSALCNTPKCDSVGKVSEMKSCSRRNSNSGNARNVKTAKSCFRKCDADYLKYGFVFSDTEDAPLPQCVICLLMKV